VYTLHALDIPTHMYNVVHGLSLCIGLLDGGREYIGLGVST
jgi:hypothetical protein